MTDALILASTGLRASRRRQQTHHDTDVMKTYLECPCCGDDGAESDDEGLFYDGQELICGCSGSVTADSDGEGSWAWINNGDEPCPQEALCHQPVVPGLAASAPADSGETTAEGAVTSE